MQVAIDRVKTARGRQYEENSLGQHSCAWDFKPHRYRHFVGAAVMTWQYPPTRPNTWPLRPRKWLSMYDSGWELNGLGGFFAAFRQWPWMESTASAWSLGRGAIMGAVQRHLVGREVEVDCAGSPIRLTVVRLEAEPDSRALSVGQLGEVVLTAQDVNFAGFRSPGATATFQNAHLRPGSPTQLVAAPVNLQVELDNDTLAQLMRKVTDRLNASVDDKGVGRLAWGRYPHIGHVEVDASIVNTALTLRPRHLVAFGRRWALPRWMARYSMPLPAANGLLVRSVALQPGSIVLSATLQEWRYDVPRARWEDVLAQLSPANR
jgi:hypothetical protein